MADKIVLTTPDMVDSGVPEWHLLSILLYAGSEFEKGIVPLPSPVERSRLTITLIAPDGRTTTVVYTGQDAADRLIALNTANFSANPMDTMTLLMLQTDFPERFGGEVVDVPPPPPATQTGITIAPPTAVVSSGLTQQYTATANFDDSSTRDVTADAVWTTTGGTVVAGLFTAAQPGTFTITATHAGFTHTAVASVVV